MKNKTTLTNIGNNIKLARIKKGLTQEMLSEKCNVSTKYISAMERGISSGSISLIIDICNILDVTPNYIFGTTIKNANDTLDVIPSEILSTYLKFKPENKEFIGNTIRHLYSMQSMR